VLVDLVLGEAPFLGVKSAEGHLLAILSRD
jgi:hypothetical protein